MERYCGILQAGLRSRQTPWANLNRRLLHMAYLSQLRAKYDLEEELGDAHKIRGQEVSKREKSIPGCK